MGSLKKKGKTFNKILKKEGISGIWKRRGKFFKIRKSSEEPYIKDVEYSPDIKFYNYDDIRGLIKKYQERKVEKLRFLDVGGRFGEYSYLAEGFEYSILEIDESIKESNVINGDICHIPEIPDNFFDVVFSNNVFEHIKEPWRAAEESVRITKKGGIVICVTPFSWRYHPVPVDTFRYSHYGLAYLFERTSQIKRHLAGYDIQMRRKDMRGGNIKGGVDKPPIDSLGGWRENWETIYVGYKK